jgi:hypothetical protein
MTAQHALGDAVTAYSESPISLLLYHRSLQIVDVLVVISTFNRLWVPNVSLLAQPWRDDRQWGRRPRRTLREDMNDEGWSIDTTADLGLRGPLQ